MKKPNSERKEKFTDALIEIVATVVLFGIGALVLSLFGGNTDAWYADGDLLIIIGCAAIAVPLAIVWGVSRYLQRKKSENTENETEDKR